MPHNPTEATKKTEKVRRACVATVRVPPPPGARAQREWCSKHAALAGSLMRCGPEEPRFVFPFPTPGAQLDTAPFWSPAFRRFGGFKPPGRINTGLQTQHQRSSRAASSCAPTHVRNLSRALSPAPDSTLRTDAPDPSPVWSSGFSRPGGPGGCGPPLASDGIHPTKVIASSSASRSDGAYRRNSALHQNRASGPGEYSAKFRCCPCGQLRFLLTLAALRDKKHDQKNFLQPHFA